jgi:hypothetical protein
MKIKKVTHPKLEAQGFPLLEFCVPEDLLWNNLFVADVDLEK